MRRVIATLVLFLAALCLCGTLGAVLAVEIAKPAARTVALPTGELPVMGTYALGLWSIRDRCAEIQVYHLSDRPVGGEPREIPERFRVSLRIGTRSAT